MKETIGEILYSSPFGECVSDWLEKIDQKQYAWIVEYLGLKGVGDPSLRNERDLLRYWSRKLLDTAENELLVKKMKGALRQKQYRERLSGRKECSFILDAKVKKKLDDLASHHETTVSSMLERLINQAARRELKKTDEEKPKHVGGMMSVDTSWIRNTPFLD